MTVKVCGCHSYLDIFLYADLVGKHYADGARGPEAYDCLGLAIEIQRRRGFTVPDFISSEAELHAQLASGGFLDGCEKLEAAEYGCVALIRNSNRTHHLGTMITKHRMIHTTAHTGGAVIESILGPLWNRRILGFYALGRPA
jgi:hypothetical protein